MKISKYLSGALLVVGMHVGVMAQDTDADAQASAKYREKPSVTDTSSYDPNWVHKLDNGLEAKDAMGSNDLPDAFRDEAFFRSLKPELGNQEVNNFNYQDQNFSLNYNREANGNRKIIAKGDPAEYLKKYQMFKYGPSQNGVSSTGKDMDMVRLDTTDNSSNERNMKSKTVQPGMDNKSDVNARNYQPEENEVNRIGESDDPAHACALKPGNRDQSGCSGNQIQGNTRSDEMNKPGF